MTKTKFTVEQRNEIMRLYRPYLSDAVLGKPFGLSRTRTNQILGPKKTVVTAKKVELLEFIRKVSRNGQATDKEIQIKIQDELGVAYSPSTVYKLRQEAGAPYHHKTIEDRRQEIKSRLREFIKSGSKFNTGQLRIYDNNLFAAMTRTSPNEKSERSGVNRYVAWAEEVGAVWEGRLSKK